MNLPLRIGIAPFKTAFVATMKEQSERSSFKFHRPSTAEAVLDEVPQHSMGRDSRKTTVPLPWLAFGEMRSMPATALHPPTLAAVCRELSPTDSKMSGQKNWLNDAMLHRCKVDVGVTSDTF